VENKKIAIVGVLDKKGSTNISMAKAFFKLGFDVIPINYRTLISTFGMETFESIVLSVIENEQPVMTIFCKCNGLNPNFVDMCSEKSITWLWNPDPIQTIKMCPEVIEHAKRTNFSSCTGGGVVDYFVSKGVTNCYHIYDGVDYDIFRPMSVKEELKADISFIGGKTKERDLYIEALVDAGYNVKCYGNGYGQEAINDKFSQVCSSSKMMLSLNTYNDIPFYFSNRLLRYMGCGSCVVHLDTSNALDKRVFIDGSNIITFNDIDSLLPKVKHYLQHPEEMSTIAFNGRSLVLNNLTWEHSMIRMLQIANEVLKKEVDHEVHAT